VSIRIKVWDDFTGDVFYDKYLRQFDDYKTYLQHWASDREGYRFLRIRLAEDAEKEGCCDCHRTCR
jgi:hypothetical protein